MLFATCRSWYGSRGPQAPVRPHVPPFHPQLLPSTPANPGGTLALPPTPVSITTNPPGPLADVCSASRVWSHPPLLGKLLPSPQPTPAHLGAPWDRAAGHRPVCRRASPVGHSRGQCPSPGSTSRPASAHPPRRSWCTDEGERTWQSPTRWGRRGTPPSHQAAESQLTQDT